MEQAGKIPQPYLKAYCLKGTGSQEGSFLIDRKLRNRISFMQVNLNASLPKLGEFDLVFLRNVMIYFDMETKQQVVKRILGTLRPGGHLFVGHSESLNGVVDNLKLVSPSIYQKP
jgi:chemotaxis protein methyltransferase CheR